MTSDQQLPTPRMDRPPVSSRDWDGHPDTAQHVYRLPNGFGLSVTRPPGYDRDRWEAGPIRFSGPEATGWDLIDEPDRGRVCRSGLTDEQVALMLLEVARWRP